MAFVHPGICIETALERTASAQYDRDSAADDMALETSVQGVGGKADDLLHVDTQCFGYTRFCDAREILLDEVYKAVVHEFLLRIAVRGSEMSIQCSE